MRRIAPTVVAVLALAFALAPGAEASTPPPSSCLAYATAIGKVLGIGASVLRDSAQYPPLIQKAALAGVDNSASELKTVSKKTSAIDAQLTALTATAKSTAATAVSEGKACRAAAPACSPLVGVGAQMLGILGTAAGYAGGYRSRIVAAAKAGHDQDTKALEAVLAREQRVTSQLVATNAKLTKTETRIRPVEKACHG